MQRLTFGFKHGRSAEEAVSSAVSTIQDLRRDFPLVVVVSLDIKGAFDHARWHIILRQCAAVGFPWYLIGILRSYFHGRTVSLANRCKSLQRGCPQGSVLGPLLWNISFNEILHTLEQDPAVHSSFSQCFCR